MILTTKDDFTSDGQVEVMFRSYKICYKSCVEF